MHEFTDNNHNRQYELDSQIRKEIRVAPFSQDEFDNIVKDKKQSQRKEERKLNSSRSPGSLPNFTEKKPT